MFDDVGRPEQRKRDRVQEIARVVWHSRGARITAALLVTVGITGAVLATWAYGQAVSDNCARLSEVDLDVGEIIAIKRRMDVYQHDPDPDAFLELSADETAFLLQNNLGLASEVHFVGDRASGRVAVPNGEVCYNVDFAGEIAVVEGVAVLIPHKLIVGKLTVTPLLAGRRLVLRPSSLTGKSADLLENTRGAEVRDGMLRVRFANRWEVW